MSITFVNTFHSGAHAQTPICVFLPDAIPPGGAIMAFVSRHRTGPVSGRLSMHDDYGNSYVLQSEQSGPPDVAIYCCALPGGLEAGAAIYVEDPDAPGDLFTEIDVILTCWTGLATNSQGSITPKASVEGSAWSSGLDLPLGAVASGDLAVGCIGGDLTPAGIAPWIFDSGFTAKEYAGGLQWAHRIYASDDTIDLYATYSDPANSPHISGIVGTYEPGLAPAVSITGFSPAGGLAGTHVILSGSGFSSDPISNTVQINGVNCPVVAASVTQMEIVIPTGASSGIITIQTPGGSAATASPFSVTPVTDPPIINSFSPLSGAMGSSVILNGAHFGASPGGNTVTFGALPAIVSSASENQLMVIVPDHAISGPITVTTPAGSAISATEFQVLVGSASGGILPDSYQGAEDSGPMSPQDLIGFLRALLKDSADDIRQLGLQEPTWPDSDLYRYLELARGEYNRHRPQRLHVITTTVQNQQYYPAPEGSVAIDDVLWAPGGFDLDQISAMAAAIAGGPGILWGGGVPVVGRVYFDSPASIRIWSIIREAWRQAFGGQWIREEGGFDLIPTPTESGLNVLVFYRADRHWSEIEWRHRTYILGTAVLYAVEGLTYQVVASSPAQGQKLNLGLRALGQMVQAKYVQMLNLREPGVMAGRS